MSKKKGKKEKTRKVKQQPVDAFNNFVNCEDDKIRQLMLHAKWDAFPDMSGDCKLPLSKTPSPVNCRGCELDCKYNRSY